MEQLPVEQLDTLMSREQILLDRMLYLAHVELSHMENGSDETLNTYLEEAQSIRELVDSLEDKCASLLPETGARSMASLLPDRTARLHGTIEELLRTDRRLNELAGMKLDSYRAQLSGIRRSGRQIGRYVNPFSQMGGIYIDMNK